jgi:hypothetical protein
VACSGIHSHSFNHADTPPELDSLPEQVRAVQLASSNDTTACSSTDADDGLVAVVSVIEPKKRNNTIKRGFFDSKPAKPKARLRPNEVLMLMVIAALDCI